MQISDIPILITDWLMAIGTVATAIVALFVAFLPTLRSWWNEPRFKIEFKNEEPFCRCANLFLEPSVRNVPAYWIRLRVWNVGRSVARGCEGKLVRITDAETKEDLKDFDPVVLHWVGSTTHGSIDINKKEYEYLDVVYLRSDDLPHDRKVNIYAGGEMLPRGINLTPPLRDYIFHIVIYSENVDPLEKSYYFKSHHAYFKNELYEYKA